MKKTNGKVAEEILFYAKKLPPVKQIEALDFVKWLWGGVSTSEEYTKEEIKKLEALAHKKGGAKFDNWQSAKKYIEGLSR